MVTFKKKPNTDKELLNILNPRVKEWFFSKFPSFSLPQLYGVMEIHSRNNILVSAPTGATKTLTGFLSILNELVDLSEKGLLEDRVYAVYISPLKALNEDIKVNLIKPLEEINEIAGKDLGIRVGVRTGDTTPYEKSKMLKKPPHILITTPESFSIMLSAQKFTEHLKNIEWMVVDEVHALAENKRGTQLSLAMEQLERTTTHVTRVGLSATIAPIEEIAQYLVGYDNGKPRDCIIADVQFLKDMDLKVLSPVDDLIDISYDERSQKMYELLNDLIQEHKTTLIFTNTRAGTERVINTLKDKFPKNYAQEDPTVGAHHGSLSKEYRHGIEQRLRDGKMKLVVSSTSLELGIDIGSIDLVVLLGSPKSVARAIQRIGRSGHRLHQKAIGRIVVLDRDDLVECSVLLKSIVEKKIDRIHIPSNALDVLAQFIYGTAVTDKIHIDELFDMIKKSYAYHTLKHSDFYSVIEYLSGAFHSLEDRHIYAKIWYDKDTGMIGRKGRMSRVIYMTNVGTIPDETFVTVKVGSQPIGKIDEAFLEKLKRGDVFVLGGEKYEFLYARGMVAQVNASVHRPPTIPSWFSEMLPLSFDLAMEIGKFRRLMEEKFANKRSKKEVIKFINEYLYVDDNAAEALYNYCHQQFLYAEIPSDKKLLIEYFTQDNRHYTVFHSLYGRRVNDCLSRAMAFAITRTQHRDVEIGISDNGFYLAYDRPVNVLQAFSLLKSSKIELVLNKAIDSSEILRRRFRHCAGRSMMILRNYMGRKKRVGRQQVSSMILMTAVKRISNDFPILKEARREVLEDLMDIDNTKIVLKDIESKKTRVKHITTKMPSPFAFKLVLDSATDIMKMEDRIDFLRRMHKQVMESIK